MVLCIAIGNALRGDDGVAHRALELIRTRAGVSLRSVVQLTPELGEEIATARSVIFLDADPLCVEPRIEAVAPDGLRVTPLTHAMTPAQVVAVARHLYGFKGQTFLCRVPAADFNDGPGLSQQAEEGARSAAEIAEKLLAALPI
ncbi:MAG TPA: hydrogenase maturation protease [Terriglobales bacterium]|nr:hydrogenase maturation protease [Terriglobales bacterium]